ncbi:MAG: ribosome maturation factor RimM [Sphaerospermopsis sp. SIO1G2]|nr:ribosome maturation factor RimM [Sphaerospermopsis sp. SIO1G1]NET69678.1 ribosome maturation factor RimM [Sphaerospermopsis sp. SIO1G2]
MNHKERKQGSRKQGAGGNKENSSASGFQSSIPNLDDWMEIGKIVAPQGLSGEVRVYSHTDFPERFEEAGTRWILRPGESEPQAIELLKGRYLEGKNLYVIKLAGVSDRNAAENLRNCQLFVPISDRLELEEGEFHVMDLLGLPVFMQETGQLIGTVVDLMSTGHDLLKVKFDPSFTENQAEKTILIPFVMEIVPIVDLENQRIEITPPPGLLSLND